MNHQKRINGPRLTKKGCTSGGCSHGSGRGAVTLWVLAALTVCMLVKHGTAEESKTGSPSVSSTSAAKRVTLNRCRIEWVNQVILASDRAGILSFVEPTAGGRVEAHQKVAGLKDEVAQAAFATAQAQAENRVDIEYSKLAAQLAEVEYERNQAAYKKYPQSVPELELKRLELAAQRANMQTTKTEQEQKIAELTRDQRQAELATYRIEAPLAGLVTRLFKAKGEAVNQGDPILELVNTDLVRVEGELEITDVWKVQRGDSVTVQLDIPEVDLPVEKEKFIGRVTFVDVTVDPVRRRTRVAAEVENKKGLLRAGLTAQMVITPANDLSTDDTPASLDR